MSNRTIFALIGVLLTLMVGGLAYIWNQASGWLALLPDYSTTTCNDLGTMSDAKLTYVMTRLIMHHNAKGGTVENDAEGEAFGLKIAEACDGHPEKTLLSIVDEMAPG
jgi:hypothetical protein